MAATTAAGRFSCSRVIRSRCTHLLTLADNFLGWELRNCLQMKRVLGIFFLSFLIFFACVCVCVVNFISPTSSQVVLGDGDLCQLLFADDNKWEHISLWL